MLGWFRSHNVDAMAYLSLEEAADYELLMAQFMVEESTLPALPLFR